jgi:hypothetical protein
MQWRKYPDEQPPLNVRVVVSDGEEIGVDTFREHYEIDGCTLLPSDERRKTMTPELRFSRYSNVTHWIHVELPRGEE